MSPAPSQPSRAPALTGLYAILDPQAYGWRPLVDCLRDAAAAGCRIFQFRPKAESALAAYRQAMALRQAAADARVLFLVNDRCDLALAVEADGVHLGQDDLPLAMARAIMGPDRLIGISTHRDSEVVAATQGGADYVGFGPIFPTRTKPDHEPVVGTDGLRQARRLTTLPIFAIGGITLSNVDAVKAAGADGVAVISVLAQAADLAGTVKAFMSRLAR